jgi:hypothetical protein
MIKKTFLLKKKKKRKLRVMISICINLLLREDFQFKTFSEIGDNLQHNIECSMILIRTDVVTYQSYGKSFFRITR